VAFADNLKHLPGISHLAAVDLIDGAGKVVARIDNKPGQAGSVAVYNHLGLSFGAITPEAAKKGLEIYAEHGDDARATPGKHPNIDRLLTLIDSGTTLRIKHVFATERRSEPASEPSSEPSGEQTMESNHQESTS
jgi:hypothetical protein